MPHTRERLPRRVSDRGRHRVGLLSAAPAGDAPVALPQEGVGPAGGDGGVAELQAAARERLPAAIAEFDVGGLVRRKVSDYPLEKLEELVLLVAEHHLKTIELFGAVIGLWIGVGQAIYFWLTYIPKH